MSAIAHHSHHSHSPAPVRIHAPTKSPHLRLVQPFEHVRLAPEVYRRRRVIVGIAATVALLVLASVVNDGLSRVWHRVSVSVAASGATEAIAHQPVQLEWTVRPGDTLWGIARAMQPTGDFRPVLDKLATKYKHHPLQVGETISIE